MSNATETITFYSPGQYWGDDYIVPLEAVQSEWKNPCYNIKYFYVRTSLGSEYFLQNSFFVELKPNRKVANILFKIANPEFRDKVVSEGRLIMLEGDWDYKLYNSKNRSIIRFSVNMECLEGNKTIDDYLEYCDDLLYDIHHMVNDIEWEEIEVDTE